MLHGARRWGLLIPEISFIIAVPTSLPIFITAVRCLTRNRNCRTAKFYCFAVRYRIRYSIRHRIRHRIRYLPFFFELPYRRSKMTYDVVGPKPTTSYTTSYTISYNNLRHRRSNLRCRRFDLRHRRFLPTSCQSYLRYYLRRCIRHRRFYLRCRMRYYKIPTIS